MTIYPPGPGILRQVSALHTLLPDQATESCDNVRAKQGALSHKYQNNAATSATHWKLLYKPLTGAFVLRSWEVMQSHSFSLQRGYKTPFGHLYNGLFLFISLMNKLMCLLREPKEHFGMKLRTVEPMCAAGSPKRNYAPGDWFLTENTGGGGCCFFFSSSFSTVEYLLWVRSCVGS